jgi:hypothetical protein
MAAPVSTMRGVAIITAIGLAIIATFQVASALGAALGPGGVWRDL